MKVTVVCSDPKHPIYPRLEDWVLSRSGDQAELLTRVRDAQGGDILLLISCSELVKAEVRGRYQKTLVVHASDLPRGRGWSPHIWQILDGADEITVTLLEAEDRVDSGAIWAQRRIEIPNTALYDEIHDRLFNAELDLMSFAVDEFSTVQPKPQSDDEATYFPRRTPEDSRLDPELSIASQFDLMRVADPDRYPAFFDHRGARYQIRLTKLDILDTDEP